MDDVHKILRVHRVEGAPLWDEEHQNHVVRLRGQSLDGRATELVVGLQEVGPCILITIKDLSGKAKRR